MKTRYVVTINLTNGDQHRQQHDNEDDARNHVRAVQSGTYATLVRSIVVTETTEKE
jgi:hypothetical protein